MNTELFPVCCIRWLCPSLLFLKLAYLVLLQSLQPHYVKQPLKKTANQNKYPWDPNKGLPQSKCGTTEFNTGHHTALRSTPHLGEGTSKLTSHPRASTAYSKAMSAPCESRSSSVVYPLLFTVWSVFSHREATLWPSHP